MHATVRFLRLPVPCSTDALTAGVLAGGAITGAVLRREHAAPAFRGAFIAATLETLLNASMRTTHTLARTCAGSPPTRSRWPRPRSRRAYPRSVERVALFHDIGKIHEALYDIIHDRAQLSRRNGTPIATHRSEVRTCWSRSRPSTPASPRAFLRIMNGGTAALSRGLRGDAFRCRRVIVAICDSFDAITTPVATARQGSKVGGGGDRRGAGDAVRPGAHRPLPLSAGVRAHHGRHARRPCAAQAAAPKTGG